MPCREYSAILLVLFELDEPLPIAPGKGWMLILDETPRTLRSVQAASAYETRQDEPRRAQRRLR